MTMRTFNTRSCLKHTAHNACMRYYVHAEYTRSIFTNGEGLYDVHAV